MQKEKNNEVYACIEDMHLQDEQNYNTKCKKIQARCPSMLFTVLAGNTNIN